MRVLAGLLCIVTQVWTVKANVEKTIFLGPSPVFLPNVRPSLDDLRLHVLSPSHTILPTQLPVRFSSKSAPRGLESWYLLQDLEEGRRYEVRICWPATQPTDFWLDTYLVQDVFDTPDLISSLAYYSEQLHEKDDGFLGAHDNVTPPAAHSVLFLRIQAAASYYSTNRTLMEHPELVDVDIILDPCVLNILPQSLGLFAIYLTAVAVGAWFLSGYIYRWLLYTVAEPPAKPHTD
ncbi:hypothetical protein EK21DRAFT_69491 [Setomelanomma holmii]|uniref:Phosphatidylinositol-glycan biosynthesis class X protein n=1 Tax=Setomelanomma holmii TaxID=210430 RepID=A0A9P4H7N3_9PLEO|nr:hypothetical protein EK21DRAFT_69491 [Setomelanomma holmii]